MLQKVEYALQIVYFLFHFLQLFFIETFHELLGLFRTIVEY
jgi:hypothetical protein